MAGSDADQDFEKLKGDILKERISISAFQIFSVSAFPLDFSFSVFRVSAFYRGRAVADGIAAVSATAPDRPSPWRARWLVCSR
jgi:hypothetical protein